MNHRYFQLILLFIILISLLIFWPIGPSEVKNEANQNLQATEQVGPSPSPVVLREPPFSQDEVGLQRKMEDSRTVVVSVLEEGNLAPVDAAKIFYEDGNQEGFLGRTGPTGEISVASLSKGLIIVRHPNFSPKMQWIDDPQNLTNIVVLLETDARIVGKIVADGKSNGFEDFHVIAWDVMLRPTRMDWEKWLSGLPSRIIDGTVSEEGEFVFTGLDEARAYQLLCGGPGFLSRNPSERIFPSSLPTAMPVAPLFGCRINVRGQPPSKLPSMLPRFWHQHSIEQAGFLGESVHPREQKLLLAGISTPFIEKSSEIFIFYQPLEGDYHTPGPVHSRYFLPGFEIVNSSTSLESTEEEIVQYSIELPPASSDFGSLMIRFAGQRGPSSLASQGVSATANLKLLPQSGVPIEYQILDLEKPFSISGIPFGQYSYRISFGKGLRPQVLGSSVFEGNVFIGTETEIISVSVNGIGGLEARFSLPNGRAYRGPAMVTLSSIDENGGDQPRVFRRAPYRFIGLPNGRYLVKAYQFSANGGIEQEISSGEILVYGQEMTFVEIPLPQNDIELF